MENKRLDSAALAAGISPSYINAHGKPQSIGAETKRRLLAAMHGTTTGPQAVVPNVKVYTAGKKMALPVEGRGEFAWLLTTEEGEHYKGRVTGGKKLNLPATLPEGYHTLTLTQDEQRTHCRIIVAPPRCYEPQALLEGKKLWGACVQLYTLRSEKNWGIGDFGDLKSMLVDVATRGGAFIGLNPIHALYPANPESASPYSPSSRRWLNVIYIDVNAVEDFRLSEEAQAWWQMPATQQKAATGARCAMGGLRYRYRAENHGAADGVDAVCRSRRCANGGVSSLYRPRRREPLLAGGIRRAACVSGKRG
ncbi:4-alpha-glucanotransferase [Salmonella enterica subsp. enterica serovar Daytona]|uniref:4-alpha-glucanotransferase n=1 Tax=Salmonella enterica subsp. enterica serovar Daytona TaxID=1962639 RepID=A0A447JB23_SALET|nr:4-alpha-glucanotransferase [Salmonella enterica subsp. enterica serovar Daytona]